MIKKNKGLQKDSTYARNACPSIVNVESQALSVLFDGECPMCNSFLRWLDICSDQADIVTYATSDAKVFCSLQDSLGMAECNTLRQSTIIVSDGDRIYLRSCAVRILLESTNNQLLKVLSYFIRRLGPEFADRVYTWVARVRRRLSLGPRRCKLYIFSNIQIL